MLPDRSSEESEGPETDSDIVPLIPTIAFQDGNEYSAREPDRDER